MIEVVEATYFGTIIFAPKQEINVPLKIILKDNNLEGEIYTISYDKLSTSHQITISSVVLPFLKSPYLELTIGSFINPHNLFYLLVDYI